MGSFLQWLRGPVQTAARKHVSSSNSGFLKGHQSSQGQVCGLHQGLRGSHTHGLWTQPQHPLHGVLRYHQEAEGGVWAFGIYIKTQKLWNPSFSLFLHSLSLIPPSCVSFCQIIKKLIERKQAQIRKVYPGLSCFKEGVRQIPIESIPGIRTLLIRTVVTVCSIYIIMEYFRWC